MGFFDFLKKNKFTTKANNTNIAKHDYETTDIQNLQGQHSETGANILKENITLFACKYTYCISHISENDCWLFIECNEEDSTFEYNPFIELIKSITQKWNNNEWKGNITSVGDMQYKIKNDPLDLVYQWDDLYGIVFDYTNTSSLDYIKTFLAEYYEIR